jgi:hypothetical protein
MADDQEPRESWWAALETFRAEVNERLAHGDEIMANLKAGVDENTRMTRQTKDATEEIKETTAEIREFLITMKSLMKLGNMLSAITIKVWKPLSYISATFAAVGSLYLAWKSSGK